jgi:hypothetical protein
VRIFGSYSSEVNPASHTFKDTVLPVFNDSTAAKLARVTDTNSSYGMGGIDVVMDWRKFCQEAR